jgi:RNA polymerase sigma-70 factor (ECF subfamily)
MKKLSKEEEGKILETCVLANQCIELVRQYINLVGNVAKKTYVKKGIRYSPQDIEDRRQDVFLALFNKNKEKLRLYNPVNGLSLDGWIRLITVRSVLDYFKSRKEILNKKEPGLRIPIEDMEDDIELIAKGKHSNPERETLHKITLMDALEKLPPDQRLVLKLEYIKGLSVQEIAEITGKTVNNIYQIKNRALKRLKKEMG